MLCVEVALRQQVQQFRLQVCFEVCRLHLFHHRDFLVDVSKNAVLSCHIASTCKKFSQTRNMDAWTEKSTFPQWKVSLMSKAYSSIGWQYEASGFFCESLWIPHKPYVLHTVGPMSYELCLKIAWWIQKCAVLQQLIFWYYKELLHLG